MSRLSYTQQHVHDLCVAELTKPKGEVFAPVLLTGRTGAGKRFLAKAIAETFGVAFREIPLVGPARALRTRLFGTESESRRAVETQKPPGEICPEEASVVYLSNLQSLPEDLHHTFHRLLAHRTYQDPSATEWRLPKDVILIVSLTDGKLGQVSAEHWLRQHFGSEIQVQAPTHPKELAILVHLILDEEQPDATLSLSPDQAAALVKAADGNLRRLSKWLRNAALGKLADQELLLEDVWQAINNDAESLLAQITYCGSAPRPLRYQSWAAQFPEHLRGTPIKIVRHIQNSYYIGLPEFHNAIQSLMTKTGISPGTKVVFCRWQYLGRSAELIASELKNRGAWKVATEINLNSPRTIWPSPDTMRNVPIILADDLAGSGKTLGKLFLLKGNSLRDVAQYYPSSPIFILLIAAYEDALRDIRETLKTFVNNIRIDVYRLLNSRDRCFTTDSQIFSSAEEQAQMRDYCYSVASKHYPTMPQDHWLGYKGGGSLCVFHNTVPNNTLPLIWYDKDGTGWTPLFPARGLEGEMRE